MEQSSLMLKARCIVCDSLQARYALTQVGHDVLRCVKCGFLFVHPTPTLDELAHFYDQAYNVPFERYARNTARNERRIIDLERWQPGGRLLEVGASYGHGLIEARKRGWDVAGVELSPTASEYACREFGLDVFNGDLLDAPFVEESFDAAVMWHVLEHTHDPVAQLVRLRRLLRPGGVLGLRVPNAGSLGARLAGRSWPWMCPPAHLWYFSQHTLPRLLARLDYEVIEVAALRGDGNNLYQHALIAAGGRLNGLRRSLQRRTTNDERRAGVGDQGSGIAGQAMEDEGRRMKDATRNTQHATRTTNQTPNPPALQGAWVRLLASAQPHTDTLARWTRGVIEPLETAGWGDELVCYARRMTNDEGRTTNDE
jgi:SAM-dependent methyltransferase